MTEVMFFLEAFHPKELEFIQKQYPKKSYFELNLFHQFQYIQYIS